MLPIPESSPSPQGLGILGGEFLSLYKKYHTRTHTHMHMYTHAHAHIYTPTFTLEGSCGLVCLLQQLSTCQAQDKQSPCYCRELAFDAKAKPETEFLVAATNSCSLRANIMISNVFPSAGGNITHYSLKPFPAPCSWIPTPAIWAPQKPSQQKCHPAAS